MSVGRGDNVLLKGSLFSFCRPLGALCLAPEHESPGPALLPRLPSTGSGDCGRYLSAHTGTTEACASASGPASQPQRPPTPLCCLP